MNKILKCHNIEPTISELFEKLILLTGNGRYNREQQPLERNVGFSLIVKVVGIMAGSEDEATETMFEGDGLGCSAQMRIKLSNGGEIIVAHMDDEAEKNGEVLYCGPSPIFAGNKVKYFVKIHSIK